MKTKAAGTVLVTTRSQRTNPLAKRGLLDNGLIIHIYWNTVAFAKNILPETILWIDLKRELVPGLRIIRGLKRDATNSLFSSLCNPKVVEQANVARI